MNRHLAVFIYDLSLDDLKHAYRGSHGDSSGIFIDQALDFIGKLSARALNAPPAAGENGQLGYSAVCHVAKFLGLDLNE